MANYTLCITAANGGGFFPVFLFKSQGGTPTTPITINSIFAEGYNVGYPSCTTAVASIQNTAGISFTPSSTNYSLSYGTVTGSWSSVNFVTIYNLTINGTPIVSNPQVFVNGSDTITIYQAVCQTQNTFSCPPEPSPSPTITPTTTVTPTKTTLYCSSGVTTGSYYYTDCCGNFITGTDVGLSIVFNPTLPYIGVNNLNSPATTSCATPSPTPTQTQTPTPSITPTLTPTPSKTPGASPTPTSTPAPTPVYSLKNTCDVFTLFDLGVECSVLSEPTDSISANGILTLNITGGTNPYTIYWSDSPSKDKTRVGLKQGTYAATVVDFYGDYTASTICTLQAPAPSPSPTATLTPTPTKAPVYSSLCVLITNIIPSLAPIQFVYGGIVNSYPVWTSGGYTMSWNMNNKRWEIQGLTVANGILVSTTTNRPPLSNWTIVGGNVTPIPTVTVIEGTCPVYTPFNAVFNKQDSICGSSGTSGTSGTAGSDGSISITTSGGVPPYLYSKDGGSTFTSSNIFNSLAPGSYNVIAKDSVGNIAQQTIQILGLGGGTTYTLSISNYQLTTVSSTYKKSSWIVNVNPPIPIGTVLTFDIAIESVQEINGPGSGTITSFSQVFSGATLLSPNSTVSSSEVTTRDGCSPESTTATTIVQKYSVSMTNNTIISGITNSSLVITSGEIGSNGCVTNLTQTIKAKPQQATASGCQCCTIDTNVLSSGGILGHSLSYGQGSNTQNYFSFIIGVGTTESGACSDWATNTNRTINSSTFGVGVTVFSGNPTNPTPLLGYNYCVYDGNLYYMNSSTGMVTGPVLGPGNLIVSC